MTVVQLAPDSPTNLVERVAVLEAQVAALQAAVAALQAEQVTQDATCAMHGDMALAARKRALNLPEDHPTSPPDP